MPQNLSESDEFSLWLAPNQVLGLGLTLFCQLQAKLCPQIYLSSASSSPLGVFEIGKFLTPGSNRSHLSNGCHLLLKQSTKLVKKSTNILVEVLITIQRVSPFGSLAQSGRNAL
jgi:hypothetical protein